MKYTIEAIKCFCVLLVVSTLIVGLAHITVDSFNSYVDNRIRLAINKERQYVYEDLHKLYPRRVQYTRHGSPYVTEGD